MRQVLTTLGMVAAAILAWILFFLLRILWWRVRGRRPQSPESLFRVTITDDELSLQDPDAVADPCSLPERAGR